MSVVKDWVHEAALEISSSMHLISGDEARAWVYLIIEKHCPFEPGVVYVKYDHARRCAGEPCTCREEK